MTKALSDAEITTLRAIIRDYEQVNSTRDLVLDRPALKGPRSKVISVRISAGLHKMVEDRLKKLGRGRGKHWQALIESLLFDYVGQPKELIATEEQTDFE